MCPRRQRKFRESRPVQGDAVDRPSADALLGRREEDDPTRLIDADDAVDHPGALRYRDERSAPKLADVEMRETFALRLPEIAAILEETRRLDHVQPVPI